VRIAIDARPAVAPERTGIGHYTRQLLLHLPRGDPESTYVAWFLNARDRLSSLRRKRSFPDRPNLVERGVPIPATWFERTSERFELPLVEWLVRFDVLFAPNFVPPPTRSRRLVVTVHDLAFRRFPGTAPHATLRWLTRLDRYLVRATRIIAVSESTRRDVVDLYGVDPERVEVIPHGVDGETYRPPDPGSVEAVRRRFGLNDPYVLFLGGIEPRKNLPNLLAAYARLSPEVRPLLVVAGGWVPWNPEGRRGLDQALDGLPADVRSGVVVTGYVSERDKVALLGGAEALVYPSLYEGFGFPVVEAMACGTPVLTSDVSSLPEVAGDAAVLVSPEDIDSIAAGMEGLVRDDALRARLRAAGLERARRFTWEDTARRTAEILRRAGEEGR
jgi:glycosyltransferase involved in cell wall biosynthesis